MSRSTCNDWPCSWKWFFCLGVCWSKKDDLPFRLSTFFYTKITKNRETEMCTWFVAMILVMSVSLFRKGVSMWQHMDMFKIVLQPQTSHQHGDCPVPWRTFSLSALDMFKPMLPIHLSGSRRWTFNFNVFAFYLFHLWRLIVTDPQRSVCHYVIMSMEGIGHRVLSGR